MEKIPTIFDRDWNGNRKVIDLYAVDVLWLNAATATEKVDGTNVRLTVRAGELMRLEKRRNPDKAQKARGIEEPWYVDAVETDPADKHIWTAARSTDLSGMPDGEWSGEAVGPNIQGDPLNLPVPIVHLFSLIPLVFEDVPLGYEALRAWLPKQRSKLGDGPIEGIVWHGEDGKMAKIKTKDFA